MNFSAVVDEGPVVVGHIGGDKVNKTFVFATRLLAGVLASAISVCAATRFITAFGMAQNENAEQATADAISQATDNLLNECNGSASGIENDISVSYTGGDGWPVTYTVSDNISGTCTTPDND